MKKFILFIALLCAASMSYANEIYSRMTASELLSIMRSEGYVAHLDEDGDIIWKKDGWTYLIIFPERGKSATNFYFQFRFSLPKDKKAAAIYYSNEYHQAYKFGKSFATDKAVVWQLTLNISKGVTKARIVDYLDDCLVFSKTWKKQVYDKL